MVKELLTIEFRYYDKPKNEHFSGHRSKTIAIGVFSSLGEAIDEGNKVLSVLSKSFEVRAADKFKFKHLFGNPNRLVTNTCYPTNGIQYFAKIEPLKFDDLDKTLSEILEAANRYEKFKCQE